MENSKRPNQVQLVFFSHEIAFHLCTFLKPFRHVIDLEKTIKISCQNHARTFLTCFLCFLSSQLKYKIDFSIFSFYSVVYIITGKYVLITGNAAI